MTGTGSPNADKERGLPSSRSLRSLAFLWVALLLLLSLTSLRVALTPSERMLAARDSPSVSPLVPQHVLAVLIPFVTEDIPRILAGMERWAALGPACDLSQPSNVSLRFYHSQSQQQYEAQHVPYIESLLSQRPAVMRHVVPCFSSIQTVFASLTAAEDGFPSGPSWMFFRLFLSYSESLMAGFTHVYWMEWDVTPVRPYWLDRLQQLTHGEEFWMRGARYRGPAFDETVKEPSSWSWVGHLNGNALYKLHDTEFEQFLRLTVEREPPGHYWKPFDVSMWRVLCDFPYSWHLYQSYADRFQTTAVMHHLGFTITADDTARLVSSEPRLYFLHGNASSAGDSQYHAKFHLGVPRTNLTINWMGTVGSEHSISVLIRTFADDLQFAVMAVSSARQFIPQALEYVVVVPTHDYNRTVKEMPSFVTVQEEVRVLHSDHIQQKLTKLRADLYCKGDYIFHLDSDVVLFRPLLIRDLFILNKPIITFDRYANLKGQQEFHVTQWQNGTSFAVGENVELEFSRSNDHLYPRQIYARARGFLEQRHNMSLTAFLDTREGRRLNRDSNGTKKEAHPDTRLFSDFNYIGAFLYYHLPEVMAWTYVGLDRPPAKSLPYAYTAIRPPIVCQGNARIYRSEENARHFSAQLAILKRIAQGQSRGCYELDHYISTNGWLE